MIAGRLGIELDLSGKNLVFDTARQCIEHHGLANNEEIMFELSHSEIMPTINDDPELNECPSCGNECLKSERSLCPHCEEEKCSQCDMGDDVACVNCE